SQVARPERGRSVPFRVLTCPISHRPPAAKSCVAARLSGTRSNSERISPKRSLSSPPRDERLAKHPRDFDQRVSALDDVCYRDVLLGRVQARAARAEEHRWNACLAENGRISPETGATEPGNAAGARECRC